MMSMHTFLYGAEEPHMEGGRISLDSAVQLRTYKSGQSMCGRAVLSARPGSQVHDLTRRMAHRCHTKTHRTFAAPVPRFRPDF